jgi:hypothetical protein
MPAWRRAAFAACAVSLTGCAGPAIDATTPRDAEMTCDELIAERSLIQERFAELSNIIAAGPNAGRGFGGAGYIMALDDRDRQFRGIYALQARYAVLDRLVGERCAAR